MINRLTLLFLLISTPVLANTQVHLGGSSGSAINTAALRYVPLDGIGTSTAEDGKSCPIPDSGDITYMKACLSADPENGAGVQSVVFTIRLNEADAATTCTVSEGSTCCETSTGSAYAAGDRIAIAMTPANTPAAANYTVVTHTVSDTANKMFLCANKEAAADTTTVEYYTFPMNGSTTTENNAQTPFPFDTTFTGLYCASSAPASVGDTYTMTIMENGAAVSDIACAISGGTAVDCNDTASTLASVAGDTISLRVTPNSTPDAVIIGCGLGFTNTVGGFMLAGGSTSNYADAISTFYHALNSNQSYSTTENTRTQQSAAITLRAAYGALFTAPDNGALEQGYTYTIRDDAAGTGCSFFISEAEITDSDTTCTDVIAVDSAVGYELAPTLVPVATGGWVSVSAILSSEAARRVILTQ